MNSSDENKSLAFRVGRFLSFGAPLRTQFLWLTMSTLLLGVWGVVSGFLYINVLQEKRKSLKVYGAGNEAALDKWVDAENLRNSWEQGRTVLVLFWFVTIVAMTYSVVKVTAKLSENSRKWNGKWAIGGWFIPLANIVIPFQVMRESEHIIKHSLRGVKNQDLTLSGHLDRCRYWFFGNILALLLIEMAAELTTFNDDWDYDLDTYGLWCGILGSALMVAVVVLAFIYFGRQNLFIDENKVYTSLDLNYVDVGRKIVFEPPSPSVKATQDAASVSEQIRHLGKLRDEGLITSIEFEQKKSELLDRI